MRDLAVLLRDMTVVPGVEPETAAVAVGRAGVEAGLPVRAFGPNELIDAWRH